MVHWYWLWITAVTGLLNRLWRGEGQVSRATWYSFMVITALIVGHGWVYPLTKIVQLAIIWLIYFLGYALLPWQAMFSAITGESPSRKDSWYTQWMQTLAYAITGTSYGGTYPPAQWRLFGIVYGAIRACWMIPGIILLMQFYNSYIALAGLFGLAMGLVYYGGYRLALHFQAGNMSVTLSEMTMGWWLGTYILIISGIS